MRTLLLILALSLFSVSGYAKDMNDRFATLGLGSENCSHFSQYYVQGTNGYHDYNNFILGYLTAFNLIVPSTFNIIGTRSYADAIEWLQNHCRSNPSDNFTNAIAKMTQAFYDTRQNFKRSESGWLLDSNPQ